MIKKIKLTPDDLDEFYKAVKGTRPLNKQNKIRLNTSSAKHPPPPKKTADFALHFAEDQALQPVKGEEFIAYKHISISNKTLRKLRKGQYNVDAKLDLHGATVLEAKQLLTDFLQDCILRGAKVVLIIHGKGHLRKGPILKNKLNQWLREINLILAFCSAAPIHGSRGAIYVLLKKGGEPF